MKTKKIEKENKSVKLSTWITPTIKALIQKVALKANRSEGDIIRLALELFFEKSS